MKTDSGIPLITAKIVKEGRILEPFEFIAEENYETWMVRGLPEAGDVVVTTEAPLGEVAQLTDANVALAQRIVTLRGKKGVLNNDFLLCAMQSSYVQHQLESRASGSTVKGIKQSELRKVLLPVPPEEEQVAIAKHSKAIFNKIELNRQTNQTLEHIAQAIFKNWFVDFEPTRAKIAAKENGESPELAAICAISGKPEAELEKLDAAQLEQLKATAVLFPDALVESELGEIPEGWEIKPLGSIISNLDSKRVPLSKKQREDRKGVYPYYGAAAVFDYVDDYLFDGIHILMAEDGNTVVNKDGFATLQYVWGKFWVNNHAHVLKGSNIISEENIYLFLKSVKVSSYVTGAAQPKINQKNMNSIPFIKANDNIHVAFGIFVRSLFNLYRNIFESSQVLETTRDTLLPKLISGELSPQNPAPLPPKSDMLNPVQAIAGATP